MSHQDKIALREIRRAKTLDVHERIRELLRGADSPESARESIATYLQTHGWDGGRIKPLFTVTTGKKGELLVFAKIFFGGGDEGEYLIVRADPDV